MIFLRVGALALVMGLLGCGAQAVCSADCATAVRVTVHGAADAGAPVVTVTPTSGVRAGTCTTDGPVASCVLVGEGATYRFALSAPGYAATQRVVAVSVGAPPCLCPAGFDEVTLVPN